MPLRYDANGNIDGIDANTIAEAKLCIKECKLKKKELQLAKKQVAAELAAVRAQHRSKVVRNKSVIRLKGTAGNIQRGFAHASNSLSSKATDKQVRDGEIRQNRIEQEITWIDNALIELERYVLGGVD